ncbi:MAG: AMP-binding protein [Mycobacteriaceae bacterium]|nr:AMP-binding protein [Mycobacteriaceae bacterium]
MADTAVPNRIGLAAERLKAVLRLHQCGVIDLKRPGAVLRHAKTNAAYGPQAAVVMAGAQDHPDAPALADERGALSYRDLDSQSNALANALLADGLGPGDTVALLARDHRGLVLSAIAAGKAGLRLVMMNTGFAKPQFAEVARRERVRAVLHDSEFGGLLDGLAADLPRFLTWVDDTDPGPAGATTVDDLIARGDRARPAPPPRLGGFVILTSGTTGLPKGAPRTKVNPMVSAIFVDRIPIPRRSSIVVVSPLFHATGFGFWGTATALGNKAVLLRRFDAEATLRALAEHRAEMLVAVPTMLHRMTALPAEVIARYDLSALKVIVVGGSVLTPDLSERVRTTFGEVLYNLYGSTEVAIAAVAQPHELRAAPGAAGRPPVTTSVALYDAQDRRITAPNTPGRIFVRSGAPFEGYTDGRHKQFRDGHMSTGDMGHFDASGLLFIDGRDDDMIVSGGENVYPVEVENLLAGHPDVDDVAVVGVDDDEFGKRLRAYVVAAAGRTVDPQAIKAHVKSNLARHKVPRDVVLVDELPRNATGKVLRGELRQRA